MSVSAETMITTREMNARGDPLRIVVSGYPDIPGNTIMEKQDYALDKLDHLRTFLMCEPRGHLDMWGVVLVKPVHKEAHIAALIITSEGYSPMCGHATICLAKYAVDAGLVALTEPETQVNIELPCGLVKTFVNCSTGHARGVRFQSVPAFAFALDVELEVEGHGTVKVDISFGGAFYAIVPASVFGLNVSSTPIQSLIDVANKVSDAARKVLKLDHPIDNNLAFLYGTVLTDGADRFSDVPAHHMYCSAASQVARSPCGSGTTSRLAVQHKRGLIGLNQSRDFIGPAGGIFHGKIVAETRCGQFDASVAEVSGEAFYTGRCEFTAEDADLLKNGFLVK